MSQFNIPFLLLSCVFVTSALNLQSVQEFSSWFPKPDKNFNISWVDGKTFYVPLLSKSSLYKISEFLVIRNEFNAMDDAFAARRHCLLYKLNENRTKVFTQGYGSRKAEFWLHISDIIPSRWDFYLKRTQPQILETSHVVLSSKEDGMLFVAQWMDGMKSFFLTVPVGRKPNPAFLNQARRLLVNEYGFNTDNFVSSDYNDCKMEFVEDEAEIREYDYD